MVYFFRFWPLIISLIGPVGFLTCYDAKEGGQLLVLCVILYILTDAIVKFAIMTFFIDVFVHSVIQCLFYVQVAVDVIIF